MKKLLLILGGVFLISSPANAITWNEFWEPFDGDGHSHYGHRHSHCHNHYDRGYSHCHSHRSGHHGGHRHDSHYYDGHGGQIIIR